MPPFPRAIAFAATATLVNAALPSNSLRLWNCDSATNPANRIFSLPCTAPRYCPLTLSSGSLAVSTNTTYASNQVLLVVGSAESAAVQFALNESTGQLQYRPSDTAPYECACAYEGVVFEGALVVQCSCDPRGTNLAQKFTYDASSGAITSVANASLCLDSGSSYACNASDPDAPLYCQPSAATVDRVADLVGRLSAPELASLFSAALIVEQYYGANAGTPRLGVRAAPVPMRAAS